VGVEGLAGWSLPSAPAMDTAKRKVVDVAAQLKSSGNAIADSATYSKTLRSAMAAFRQSTMGTAAAIGQFYMAVLVLLLLFIVHQLFIWIDQSPDVAFERAAVLFEGAEVTWDMVGVLWNAGVDVFNSGIIPLWNSATYYLVEPAIVLALEVFSLVFTQTHWTGVLDESAFPYNGLDCMANAESASWCGRYGFYKAQLESPERASAYVNQSQALRRLYGSRLFEDTQHNETYTFGLSTARHLSEHSGGGFASPVFETAALTAALDSLSVFFVTMAPSLLDVVFGVLGDVIRTSFSVIMDAFFMLLKSTFFVLKMLIKSGLITVVVGIGVDFVIIYLTEIVLPLLFAGIDTLMCLIDYFKPSGWNDQLE